ncbi:phosphoesterase [Spirosoma montaniterrae]|uniref:Phosphoesterase n=2 Tax=Spirosoma montaniterrae TaxID=1178516 RepID=A0A1P9X482_9BACT|nr:phosphoesterase [Spirosoma montaniterrae]
MQDVDVATAWADMTLYITKNTPANSPTYASRCLGYIGLTMYESVVAESADYQSLAGQVNGLATLPQPEAGKPYHWPAALNAGQAYILKSLYNQTSDANKLKIDSLERAVQERLAVANDAQLSRSVAFGRAVAERIFAWSKTDGGHRGYLKNFDKAMKQPTHVGCWKPPLYAQSFSHYPLHPHWGKNRTFLASDAQISAPTFIPYDTLPTSAYYRQFKQVYDKERTLTQAEKECAIWWSDDPDETFTPPGHSYYLATLAIRKTRPSLVKCAETYARVGMAVADAFINCWKWKYEFFTERPNTFIPQYIDPQWDSFWPEPPFPAFPSGHAIQAAAAATVLTNLYGDRFALTDSAHAGRPRDRLRNTEFKVRRFSSFWQVAQETADSRFYGGIHTPQDNQAGLEKGKTIGEHINGLPWRVAPVP